MGNEDALFHRDFSTIALVHTNDHESIMKNNCGVYLFLDTSHKGAIIRAGSTCTSLEKRIEVGVTIHLKDNNAEDVAARIKYSYKAWAYKIINCDSCDKT